MSAIFPAARSDDNDPVSGLDLAAHVLSILLCASLRASDLEVQSATHWLGRTARTMDNCPLSEHKKLFSVPY